jgi:SAM-dependent methyltransferase
MSNLDYNTNYKQFWLQTELVPSKKEDKQLPFLIDILKEELDMDKVETVLEVGVGYGRVAKAILDTFPHIGLYDGLDISESALKQSEKYLKEYLEDGHVGYCPYPEGDFLDLPIHELYDLVISVETMSVVPESISIQPWIDKMISASKKYVVNLDYTTTTHPIFNNGHDYYSAYHEHEVTTKMWFTPDSLNSKLFICRVE